MESTNPVSRKDASGVGASAALPNRKFCTMKAVIALVASSTTTVAMIRGTSEANENQGELASPWQSECWTTVRYCPTAEALVTAKCCYARQVKIALVLILGMAFAQPASAGRTHYGWLDGTELVPERGVEIETWIQDLDNIGPGERDETQLWWSTTLGITDRLELSLPIELSWARVGAAPGVTSLDRWGAQARYRFVTSDPVDAPALVPVVRVAIKREVAERRAAVIEGEFDLSYEIGGVHALASVGVRQLVRSDIDAILVRPAAGVSVAVTGELRAGIEVVFSIFASGPGTDWVAVGPNLAWTHGRFWLAASLPLGVSNIDSAARLRWGVAF